MVQTYSKSTCLLLKSDVKGFSFYDCQAKFRRKMALKEKKSNKNVKINNFNRKRDLLLLANVRNNCTDFVNKIS